MVQGLRICFCNAGDMGLIPGQGIKISPAKEHLSQLIPAGLHTSTTQPAGHSGRVCTPQGKSPHATAKQSVHFMHIIVHVGLCSMEPFGNSRSFPLVAQSFPVDIWVTATFGFQSGGRKKKGHSCCY